MVQHPHTHTHTTSTHECMRTHTRACVCIHIPLGKSSSHSPFCKFRTRVLSQKSQQSNKNGKLYINTNIENIKSLHKCRGMFKWEKKWTLLKNDPEHSGVWPRAESSCSRTIALRSKSCFCYLLVVDFKQVI